MEEKINNLWEYKSIIIDKYKNCANLSKLHEKSYEYYSSKFKLFRICEVFFLSLMCISLIIFLFTDSKLMLIFSVVLSIVIMAMVLYNKDYMNYFKFTLHKQAIDKFNNLADQYKNLKLDLESLNVDYGYLRETLDYLNSEYYDYNLQFPRPINYKEEMAKLKENLNDTDTKHINDDGIIPKELRR